MSAAHEILLDADNPGSLIAVTQCREVVDR